MRIDSRYLVGKIFKNVSLDSVWFGRTCLANLGVRSGNSCAKSGQAPQKGVPCKWDDYWWFRRIKFAHPVQAFSHYLLTLFNEPYSTLVVISGHWDGDECINFTLFSPFTIWQSDNLQYNMLGQWDERVIYQVSDDPSVIFFS